LEFSFLGAAIRASARIRHWPGIPRVKVEVS
jgi:hypothetical protein